MLQPAQKSDVTHLLDEDGLRNELSDADRERLEKVKRRLELLLQAGKTNTAGRTQKESDTALNLAVQIARDNGLDLYKVEKAMQRAKSTSNQLFILRIMELGGHSNWRVQLVYIICKALICEMFAHKIIVQSVRPNARSGNINRHPRADFVSIIGMASDIQLVDYLYEYIVRELKSRADISYTAEKRLAWIAGNRLSGKHYRDEFFRGAIVALDGRLSEMFKRAEQQEADEHNYSEEDSTTALISLKQQDVRNAADKFFLDSKIGEINIHSKRRGVPGTIQMQYTEKAFMDGHTAGSELEIRNALDEHNANDALTSGACESEQNRTDQIDTCLEMSENTQ